MTTTAVRERPIPFKREMVQAILDGRKTQTRRVLKPQPAHELQPDSTQECGHWEWMFRGVRLHSVFCPYGQHGDRLWVREKMFQFKKDTRLWLEIAGVRVERLQEISEADALAEGVEHRKPGPAFSAGEVQGTAHVCYANPQTAFAALWDSINGKKYPWASNPFVWAITFRRIDKCQ